MSDYFAILASALLPGLFIQIILIGSDLSKIRKILERQNSLDKKDADKKRTEAWKLDEEKAKFPISTLY